MRPYSLSHLSDGDLSRELASAVSNESAATAMVLAHIAEFDARKLFLSAACESMHVYCVRELHMSDGAAYRRITAARAARQFPAIFGFVADGRLHLSAVSMLAPHLRPENAAELTKAAAHRPKSAIQQLLAERFPKSEELPLVEAIPTPSRNEPQLVPGRVGMTKSEPRRREPRLPRRDRRSRPSRRSGSRCTSR
jgi:hypothetical protein